MKLSLIIPCFNEQDNIKEFHHITTNVLSNSSYYYEFIFVNDGSNDNTLKILKEIYQEDIEHVNVIAFSRNFGKEAAIYAGLHNISGDYITIIDADLQQNPKLVLKMLEILEANPDYDCVAAYQKERHENLILRTSKKSFYKLINRLSDIEFHPGASDFRTMRRTMADAILSLPEYHRFSKGLFSWVGFETYYLPYIAEDRFSGTSKWSFISLFKYAINGIIAFTVSPLKIATYLGASFSFVSLLYMVIIVIQKIFLLY